MMSVIIARPIIAIHFPAGKHPKKGHFARIPTAVNAKFTKWLKNILI
jgi:NAD(P)H-hydrate repair Nnr-like enzyme with NAD(P)H-hydrate epimerase domain